MVPSIIHKVAKDNPLVTCDRLGKWLHGFLLYCWSFAINIVMYCYYVYTQVYHLMVFVLMLCYAYSFLRYDVFKVILLVLIVSHMIQAEVEARVEKVFDLAKNFPSRYASCDPHNNDIIMVNCCQHTGQSCTGIDTLSI